VLGNIRAHLSDLQSGQFYDAELKLFILDNGGAGKTQLSRRLRNLPLRPTRSEFEEIEKTKFPTGERCKRELLNICETILGVKRFSGNSDRIWKG
jgi:hypothetical protein